MDPLKQRTLSSGCTIPEDSIQRAGWNPAFGNTRCDPEYQCIFRIPVLRRFVQQSWKKLEEYVKSGGGSPPCIRANEAGR